MQDCSSIILIESLLLKTISFDRTFKSLNLNDFNNTY